MNIKVAVHQFAQSSAFKFVHYIKDPAAGDYITIFKFR